MKFDHSFKLYEKSKTGRTYICDNTVAKLDFISPAAIRVAIYKKGAYMLPTFTINPNNDLSQSGRDKLATDAFEMFEPVAKKTDNGEKFILKNGIEVNLDLHNFLLSYEKNGKRIFADRAPTEHRSLTTLTVNSARVLTITFQGKMMKRFSAWVTRLAKPTSVAKHTE